MYHHKAILFIVICLLGVISFELLKGSYASREENKEIGIEVDIVAGTAGVEAGNQTIWVEGKTTLDKGSIITTKYGARLLFGANSFVRLTPGSELEIIDYYPELKLSLLEGCLEVETESSSPILEISTSVTSAFVLEILNLTISPAGGKTIYRFWLDKPSVHLRVEVGQVRVRADGREMTILAGEELHATPGEEVLTGQLSTTPTPGQARVTPIISTPAATVTPFPPKPTPGQTRFTPTPILPMETTYLSPVLVGPLNRSHFREEEDILLIWAPVGKLTEDEWYEVQIWKPGETEHKVAAWSKENVWKVERKYYPGLYNWRIVVILGRDEQRQMELSPPSQTWTFSWGGARVPTLTPSSPTPKETALTPTVSLPETRIRPTPELLEPPDGQIFATPFIFLKWRWEDELAPDEYFDIQIRPEGQGESVFVDWSRQPYYKLSRWAGWKSGRYTWKIAIVRGHMEGKWKVLDQYLGFESEQRVFRWDRGGD